MILPTGGHAFAVTSQAIATTMTMTQFVVIMGGPPVYYRNVQKFAQNIAKAKPGREHAFFCLPAPILAFDYLHF